MAKVHAHEECLGVYIGELLEVEDGEVLRGEEAGDCVHDAGFVGAGEGKVVVVLGGFCGSHLDFQFFFVGGGVLVCFFGGGELGAHVQGAEIFVSRECGVLPSPACELMVGCRPDIRTAVERADWRFGNEVTRRPQ
jgi:hypothetical protein